MWLLRWTCVDRWSGDFSWRWMPTRGSQNSHLDDTIKVPVYILWVCALSGPVLCWRSVPSRKDMVEVWMLGRVGRLPDPHIPKTVSRKIQLCHSLTGICKWENYKFRLPLWQMVCSSQWAVSMLIGTLLVHSHCLQLCNRKSIQRTELQTVCEGAQHCNCDPLRLLWKK